MVLRKWLPPVIWMALIFGGSTDVLSGEHTSRFVLPFLRWIFGGRLTPDQLDWGHFLIRKAGHLTEYAVLSILLWFAMRLPRPEASKEPNSRRPWLAAGLAIMLATGYAALDEYHQSFVSCRTSSRHDVAIDAAGSIVGVAMLGAIRLCLERRAAAMKAA